MAPRPILSDEEERAERDDQSRLRAVDARLDDLHRKRAQSITEMRRLSAEQKALYDRRAEPQAEVERMYEEHGALGRRLVELRAQRESARTQVDAAVIQLRELRLTFSPSERLRPEHLRREVAELELRQQTCALTLEQENALIADLRQRTKALKEAEARTQVVAEHERQRKEAEGRIAAARARVAQLGEELQETRRARDERMSEIRAKLVAAGGLVADLRAKSRARNDTMRRVDGLTREIAEAEGEGRRLLGQIRARREEARRTLRTYTRPRAPTEELLASTAEAQLEELLKRGKVTLGG